MEREKSVGIGSGKTINGLQLVHVSRNTQRTELREATTGRPVMLPVLVPKIWAVAEPAPVLLSETAVPPQPTPPKVELAFYRKYTEAMLRRYLRLSVEVGRVPSVLGRELFRGNVSHCKVDGFEDGIIFCVDVERCLAKLPKDDQRVIKRIAIQGYTLQEAALFLGMDFRRCHEHYGRALDQLTELFLAGRLLEPQNSCQDVETV